MVIMVASHNASARYFISTTLDKTESLIISIIILIVIDGNCRPCHPLDYNLKFHDHYSKLPFLWVSFLQSHSTSLLSP